MAKTLKTTISIGGKIDKSLNSAFRAAQSGAAKAAQNIGNSFKKATATAGKIAAIGATAATAAVVAFTGVAVKNAAEMQTQMQNVATLLDGTTEQVEHRTAELQQQVIDISNATGIATSDLTAGLYDVISAVGDTADANKILEVSAKAAAAGNAETAEAVSLLTAVTKGYGDTSGEAFQKASDLAFQTVKLGQTTFPELAASIGKVTPLANSLNVSQEELFGTFATLTGVTGSAAEVSTQFKGVLSGMMKPTKEMQAALQSLGYSTGSAAFESLGLEGTLKALMGTVNGDTEQMAKLFSSVEAQTAVLALCGSQADVFNEKLGAMEKASGSTEEAFARQTATLEYTLQRIKNLGTNFATSVGAKILPYVADLADWALPLVEDGLNKLMPYVDMAIEKAKPIIGYIAGIKDVVIQATPYLEKLGKAIPWDAIKSGASAVSNTLDEFFANVGQGETPFKALSAAMEKCLGIDIESPLRAVKQTLSPIIADLTAIGTAIMPTLEAYGRTVADYITRLLPGLTALGSTIIPVIKNALANIRSVIVALSPYIKQVIETAMPIMGSIADTISASFSRFASVIKGTVIPAINNFVSMAIAGITPILDAVMPIIQGIGSAFASLIPLVQPVIDFLIDKFGNGLSTTFNSLGNVFLILGNTIATAINIIKAVVGGVLSYIGNIFNTMKGIFDGLVQFLTGVFTGNWQQAWEGIKNVVLAAFNGIKSAITIVINTIVRAINSILTGVNSVSSKIPGSVIPQIPLIPEVALAKGGTVTSPTVAMIGEGGENETVIPHNSSTRSKELLNEAARGVYGPGASVGSSKTMNFTYAPVINGGGDIESELREDFERFKQYFEQKLREDDREVFA